MKENKWLTFSTADRLHVQIVDADVESHRANCTVAALPLAVKESILLCDKKIPEH